MGTKDYVDLNEVHSSWPDIVRSLVGSVLRSARWFDPKCIKTICLPAREPARRKPIRLALLFDLMQLGLRKGAAAGLIILDLEGEPMLPLEERAFYTTPLRDLAGLVRSFAYVGVAAI